MLSFWLNFNFNWIKQNVFLLIIKMSEINFIKLTFVSCKNIKF